VFTSKKQALQCGLSLDSWMMAFCPGHWGQQWQQDVAWGLLLTGPEVWQEDPGFATKTRVLPWKTGFWQDLKGRQGFWHEKHENKGFVSRIRVYLLGRGILVQDVPKGLHVGINAMHHLRLLPQVALHRHIDVVIPVSVMHWHASDSTDLLQTALACFRQHWLASDSNGLLQTALACFRLLIGL